MCRALVCKCLVVWCALGGVVTAQPGVSREVIQDERTGSIVGSRTTDKYGTVRLYDRSGKQVGTITELRAGGITQRTHQDASGTIQQRDTIDKRGTTRSYDRSGRSLGTVKTTPQGNNITQRDFYGANGERQGTSVEDRKSGRLYDRYGNKIATAQERQAAVHQRAVRRAKARN